MKAGKAFSENMNLFVKEQELCFTGSLLPAQACGENLIRKIWIQNSWACQAEN